MMGQEAARRVARHRERLRGGGLRPVQVWAVDSRRAGLADQVAKQCRAINRSQAERDALEWIDAAAAEVEGWS
jgi:hypothetical protein